MFKPHTPQVNDCDYANAQSEVVTMPILMKDEKKYAECVDVLDQLEKWTHDIYLSAGLCSSDYLIPSILAAFLLATRRCVQSRTHLLTCV
jgi:hypothetical protein